MGELRLRFRGLRGRFAFGLEGHKGPLRRLPFLVKIASFSKSDELETCITVPLCTVSWLSLVLEVLADARSISRTERK